jgi:single-strand DNA-binding protein
MSLNKVILIGNVGKDPETRMFDNNSSVSRFSLATSERYKDKQGNTQENTEWHNIVCWRGLSDIVDKYVKKGNRLYVEGKIRTSSWIDKSSNEKKYSTDIVADNIIILDRAPSDNRSSFANRASEQSISSLDNNSTNSSKATIDESNLDIDSDDLPF